MSFLNFLRVVVPNVQTFFFKLNFFLTDTNTLEMVKNDLSMNCK